MEHLFSQQIFGTYSRSYFTKIHPVGAELYHAETDRHDEVKSLFTILQLCLKTVNCQGKLMTANLR